MLGRLWYRKQLDIRTNLLDLLGSVARNAMYGFNIWPPSIKYWIKYWRKGSFLRQLRLLRGLKQLDRRV